MSYVDAGYTVCLTVLFGYAVGLVLRRRRLSKAVALSDPPAPDGAAAGPDGGR